MVCIDTKAVLVPNGSCWVLCLHTNISTKVKLDTAHTVSNYIQKETRHGVYLPPCTLGGDRKFFWVSDYKLDNQIANV